MDCRMTGLSSGVVRAAPYPSVHDNQHVNGYGIPSDMVASTGREAEDLYFSSNKAAGTRSTTLKLIPRQGASPEWTEEWSNLLTQENVSWLLALGRPPTPLDVQATFNHTTFDKNSLQELHSEYVEQFLKDNTRLYFMLRGSIEMDPAYAKRDIAMFARCFTQGDRRDGLGLAKWAMSFNQVTSKAGQAKLVKAFHGGMKLQANAIVSEVERHNDAMYSTWDQIAHMDKTDSSAFYNQLLDSYPEKPDTSNVVKLRTCAQRIGVEVLGYYTRSVGSRGHALRQMGVVARGYARSPARHP